MSPAVHNGAGPIYAQPRPAAAAGPLQHSVQVGDGEIAAVQQAQWQHAQQQYMQQQQQQQQPSVMPPSAAMGPVPLAFVALPVSAGAGVPYAALLNDPHFVQFATSQFQVVAPNAPAAPEATMKDGNEGEGAGANAENYPANYHVFSAILTIGVITCLIGLLLNLPKTDEAECLRSYSSSCEPVWLGARLGFLISLCVLGFVYLVFHAFYSSTVRFLRNQPAPGVGAAATISGHVEAMRAALPTLQLHVRCWHTETRRSTDSKGHSHTRTVTVVTFESTEVFFVGPSGWRDRSDHLPRSFANSTKVATRLMATSLCEFGDEPN